MGTLKTVVEITAKKQKMERNLSKQFIGNFKKAKEERRDKTSSKMLNSSIEEKTSFDT